MEPFADQSEGRRVIWGLSGLCLVAWLHTKFTWQLLMSTTRPTPIKPDLQHSRMPGEGLPWCAALPLQGT